MLLVNKTKSPDSFIKDLILDAIIVKEGTELVKFRLLVLYIILKSKCAGPKSSKIFNESMFSACKYVDLADEEAVRIIDKFNDYMDSFYKFVAENRNTIMGALYNYMSTKGYESNILDIINYYNKKLNDVKWASLAN